MVLSTNEIFFLKGTDIYLHYYEYDINNPIGVIVMHPCQLIGVGIIKFFIRNFIENFIIIINIS